MIRAIKKAYGGGLRAGIAERPVYRPGGTRGILRISSPLNPYSNPFTPRRRPILAMIWEEARQEGLRRKIRKWVKERAIL